jgi:hypothetical protein
LRTFLKEAERAGHELRCYDDALAFIAEIRDGKERRCILDAAYPQGAQSPELAGLLKVELYPYQREGALFAARLPPLFHMPPLHDACLRTQSQSRETPRNEFGESNRLPVGEIGGSKGQEKSRKVCGGKTEGSSGAQRRVKAIFLT